MEEGFFNSERIFSEGVASGSPASGSVDGLISKSATGAAAKTSNIFHGRLLLTTRERLQFIDITEQIIELARESGIHTGIINIQTRHTTTAIVVNEDEPLLLEDMRKALDRVAPPDQYYRHNDFSIRTVNMEEEETGNGHSHCQALFLRTSETLNLLNGDLQLGRWQRVFFIELDSARERTVSIMIMGLVIAQ
jgi:secondary thiamine-phosphate synthase enzyme